MVVLSVPYHWQSPAASASDDRRGTVPTYQYACTECGHAFEQFQSFSDDALTECPECQGRLRKVFNAVGVVFKGSGFYRNDSRDKKSSGSSRPTASPTTKSTETKSRHPRPSPRRSPRRSRRRSPTAPRRAAPRLRASRLVTGLWRARPAAARPDLRSSACSTARSSPAGDAPYAAWCCRDAGPWPRCWPAAAVVAGLHELRPPPPDVVAGAHGRPRPPGRHHARRARPGVGRLRRPARRRTASPRDAVGRVLAAPVRAGEPVTDVRLVGAAARRGVPGLGRHPRPAARRRHGRAAARRRPDRPGRGRSSGRHRPGGRVRPDRRGAAAGPTTRRLRAALPGPPGRARGTRGGPRGHGPGGGDGVPAPSPTPASVLSSVALAGPRARPPEEHDHDRLQELHPARQPHRARRGAHHGAARSPRWSPPSSRG